ncbi:MAG: Hsp20/alpha crystallin family protein [Desulfobulbus sp.]|nr:MAG: Hsp20/alpha crystallin family protein [Desulfobulbus sp.]RUM37768.1 MAG: Hsp20/alpha crystallin family protein [Desulfobulbus sp.]
MDSFSKKLIAELEEMERAGRRLRNMSLARMMPYTSGNWQPPVDIYEAENALYVYVELAGVDKESMAVIADERQIRIKGVRHLPPQESIACVHQLEIELGAFDREITLPATVAVDQVSSVYTDGILVVTLPKSRKTCNVEIQIIQGE